MEQIIGKKQKNILFAIGIDDYQKVSKLFNAVRDTKSIIRILNSKYQFEETDTIALYNSEATRKNIFFQFRELAKIVTGEDNLIVYYAGHGCFDETLKMGFWLPYESEIHDFSNYISNAEVTNFIKSINSKHTFLIADACFAGSLLAQNRITFNEKVEQYRSRWAFASGRLEPVSDGTVGKNSPFAASLAGVLERNTAEELRVSEIISKVQINVGNNYYQTPQGAPIFGVGDEGGEMILRSNINPKAHLLVSIPQLEVRKINSDIIGGYSESEKLEFIDPFINEMILIDGGTFQMGDRFGDGREIEKPVHEVNIKKFWLQKTVVSQDQWIKVMGTNPSTFKGGDLPVTDISWENTKEFIKKLNEITGMYYRLPTESEWEFAGSERGKLIRFGNGKNIANPIEMNFRCTEEYKRDYSEIGEFRCKPVSVSSFWPNALGIFNMSGNVWEWCDDKYSTYNANFYEPPLRRVVKGGSWDDSPYNCRVSNRDGATPETVYSHLGFRLACDELPVKKSW
ncbi:MAG: SUMF1/EgtB/PvdO family nonheme iron enzyme [Saprospiraceae bacterium]|nr:SUMF1/EgtB/PvdO family nonheme iron enzyme [Saprospiraceae bacterium]